MPARFAFCLTAILALGCAETALVCGDGLVRNAEGDCVADPVDSGQPPVDAFVPTPDAGPCGGCSDDKHCRESDSTCVECLGDGDCGSGRCELESGTCVGCTEQTDCDERERSRCNPATSMCTACVENEDCSHINGFGVCNAGECVQCTSTAGECGGNPCTVDNVCSNFGEGEQEACEPCDTDANCQGDDYFCVPMEFKGEARGGYCLQDYAAGSCTQPYAFQTMVITTLSGIQNKTFCGIDESLTTCEAVRALEANALCSTGPSEGCAEGGICRRVSNVDNRCTYECRDHVECLDPANGTRGTNCGTGTTPDGGTPTKYCGG